MVELEPVLRQYAWNLAYARALTDDVGVQLWARSGGPGLENHPAWTLGHLVTGSALVAADHGLDPELPEGWRELFERRGPADRRRPEEGEHLYPAKAEVLEELQRMHNLVSTLIYNLATDALPQKMEWRFDGYLPTRADLLLFMLVAHENVHLGQLGCWRRRFGLPSAMAAMGRGAER
jgi:hypothetical protein